MAEETFWRGGPVPARRVVVRVGDSVPASFWCAGLAGTERDAVEIQTPEGIVVIDDEHGAGWAIVTSRYRSGGGYSRLPPDSVVLRER